MIGVIAASRVQSSIPTSGLVIEWLLNANANDTSGNGRNGTIVGATATIGRKSLSNTAYIFNGTSDNIYATIPSLTAFSISTWYNQTDTTNTNNPIAIFNDASNMIRGIIASGSGVFINVYYAVGKFRQYTFNTIGAWNHIVATWDGTNAPILYINGVSVTLGAERSTGQAPNIANTFIVGATKTTTSLYAKGKIDDTRLYDRVLTQAEVTALYNE